MRRADGHDKPSAHGGAGADTERLTPILHTTSREEIRRVPVTAVADFYAGSNLLIGAKDRIAGLTLRASDADWSHGTGRTVTGRTLTTAQGWRLEKSGGGCRESRWLLRPGASARLGAG
jgi:hypothetical protein